MKPGKTVVSVEQYQYVKAQLERAEARIAALEAERDAQAEQCAEWQVMANEQEQRAIALEAALAQKEKS